MISTIVQVFGVNRELITLIKFLCQWVGEVKEREATARAEARLKAIQESKVAETDDEIWASQSKIVKNKPKP